MVNKITWPYKMIYTPSDQPTIYEELSRYLSVMTICMEMEQGMVRMLNHLQEMIEDGEAYSWHAGLSYHVAWLQHLEQG